jgi:type 1 glutamine amidotransferase
LLRIFKYLAVVIGLLLALAVLVFAIMVGPTLYRMKHNARRMETIAPTLPGGLAEPAVMVFSKTNGFRDDDSIKASNAMFLQLAQERHWGIYFTENGAVFNPAELGRFKAVVWNSVSGNVLNEAQRAAFKDWLERGGGYVGVHGAGGDPSYDWRWYVEEVIGAQFVGHPMAPQFQQATLHIEDQNHPVMRGLDATWVRTDEWYSFDRSVRSEGYHVLATLDESGYRPRMLWKNLSMGADHPVIWTHCVGRGRVFYSALGHKAETYSEPPHRRMLGNAVEWAMGPNDTGCKDGL